MKYKKNFYGMPMRTFCALVGMLFMSAIHAEAMPAEGVAASSVGAASEVAATPEVAPVAQETATAPGVIPPFEERLQLCAGCHNPDGNSVIPENPKLAGLNVKYLARQLEDFKAGKRENPVMSSIIAMVDEKEFKPLAVYFSKQIRSPGTSDKADLLAKGKQIFEEGVIGTAAPACSGCHGEDGSGSDKFPRLNGQNPAYVVSQLLNFKSGTRINDPKAVMQTVAKRMNEEEINAVAEYMFTLKEAE